MNKKRFDERTHFVAFVVPDSDYKVVEKIRQLHQASFSDVWREIVRKGLPIVLRQADAAERGQRP
jgi:hypothetical protein